MNRKTRLPAVTLAAALFGAALAIADTAVDLDAAAAKNLRSIGMAAEMYMAENRGFTPAAESQLLKYVNEPSTFLDPRGPTVVPANFSTMTPEQKAIWIDRYAGFRFALPGGIKIQQVRNVTQQPMLVSRFDEAAGPLLVCFADGHVEAFKSVPLKMTPHTPPGAATLPHAATATTTRPHAATAPTTRP